MEGNTFLVRQPAMWIVQNLSHRTLHSSIHQEMTRSNYEVRWICCMYSSAGKPYGEGHRISVPVKLRKKLVHDEANCNIFK